MPVSKNSVAYAGCASPGEAERLDGYRQERKAREKAERELAECREELGRIHDRLQPLVDEHIQVVPTTPIDGLITIIADHVVAMENTVACWCEETGCDAPFEAREKLAAAKSALAAERETVERLRREVQEVQRIRDQWSQEHSRELNRAYQLEAELREATSLLVSLEACIGYSDGMQQWVLYQRVKDYLGPTRELIARIKARSSAHLAESENAKRAANSAEPKPGDVVDGATAKAYMLANPGRRVELVNWSRSIPYAARDGVVGLLYADGSFDSKCMFTDDSYVAHKFVILPPEPTEPAKPGEVKELRARVELVAGVARVIGECVASGVYERGRIDAPARDQIKQALRALSGKAGATDA